MNKTKIALFASALMLGSLSAAQAAPVKIAVLMYGNKAEFVQLMERFGKEHPAVKSGEAVLTPRFVGLRSALTATVVRFARRQRRHYAGSGANQQARHDFHAQPRDRRARRAS